MKRVALTVLLASSVCTVPVAVSAQATAQYKNRGQCESALKQQRNQDRAASPLNPGVFNQGARANPAFECQPVYDASGRLIGYNLTPVGSGPGPGPGVG